MTLFSDAALLKGDYAKMLKNPPGEAEWKKAACDNGSEEVAQAIAKQIFGFQQSLDQKTEKLEVIALSAVGPVKVLGISPMEGDLMRIDGINPVEKKPVAIIQHVEQVSLTFTKTPVEPENPDDDGLKIGYVIFDELTERKKERDASKRKKPRAKSSEKGKSK